jgi:hypothetical protein
VAATVGGILHGFHELIGHGVSGDGDGDGDGDAGFLVIV